MGHGGHARVVYVGILLGIVQGLKAVTHEDVVGGL